MKNKLLKLIILLVCLHIILVGCSGQAKEFETFTPEHTSEVGKLFQIDSTNFIMINGGRIIEDKGNKILIVNYSWKNEGKNADTTFDNFTITASQNGEVLKPNLDYVKDKKKLVIAVEPGEILEDIEQGFILSTQEPVTLSILGSDSYFIVENKPIYTYPVKVVLDILE